MPKEPYLGEGPQGHHRWVFLHDHTWVDRFGWRWALTEMDLSYLENVRSYLVEHVDMWRDAFYDGGPPPDEAERARRAAEDPRQWLEQTVLWAALGAEIDRRHVARAKWDQAMAFVDRPDLAALLTQSRGHGD